MASRWPEHWLTEDANGHQKWGCIVEACPEIFPLTVPRQKLYDHMISCSDYDHAVAARIMSQTYCLHDGCDQRLGYNQQAALFLHHSTQHDGCKCMSSLPDFVQLIRKGQKRECYSSLVQEEVALRMAQKFDIWIIQGKPEVWNGMLKVFRIGTPWWNLPERSNPPNRKYYEAIHDMLSRTASIAADRGGPGPFIGEGDGAQESWQKWRAYKPASPKDVFNDCYAPGAGVDVWNETKDLRGLYDNGKM